MKEQKNLISRQDEIIEQEWIPAYDEIKRLIAESSSGSDLVNNEESITQLRQLDEFFSTVTQTSRAIAESDEAFREGMAMAGKIVGAVVAVAAVTAVAASALSKSGMRDFGSQSNPSSSFDTEKIWVNERTGERHKSDPNG